MTDRDARIAKNEAISREINEGIEDAMAGLSDEGYARMVCECGLPDCERRIAVTVAEYEDARRDSLRFVVATDHVLPDVERVIAQTDRYAVVEKRDGTPADVAESSDPRD